MTDIADLSPIENTDLSIFGCCCPACMTANAKAEGIDLGAGGVYGAPNPDAGDLFELLNLQQAADGTYFYTGDRNIDAALIGSKWSVTEITYSFPTSGDVYGDNYDVGFTNRNQAPYQVEFTPSR
jgi:hypothetical protein